MDNTEPRAPRKYQRSESWGSVRKLPSGRFQASYLHEGTRYTAPHTFDRKQDAQAWNSSARTDIQRGKWRDPKSIREESFGPFSDVWLEQRVSSKGEPLRPRTRAEYRRQLDRGLAVFKKDRLDSISAARVRGWHAKRMKESGATTAAREAALLRAILMTATADGILERNPVDSKLTRSSSGVVHRPPTLDELAVMVESIETSDAVKSLGVV